MSFFGRTHSPESKRKIGLASKGRGHSSDARRKIAESLRGNTNSLGKKRSLDTRRKQSEAALRGFSSTRHKGYGNSCYYEGRFFPSNQEKECYKFLKSLPQVHTLVHNFLGRFDFLVNLQLVLEYHPPIFEIAGEYYRQRRDLLDSEGCDRIPLLVMEDLSLSSRELLVNHLIAN